MKTKNSVVIPKNTERLKRIIIESCKQSKRPWFPELIPVTDFNKIIKENYDNKFILNIDGGKLKKLSKGRTLVLVGPEGGFTEEELREAEKQEFVKTSISKNMLRIETAAIAIAAVIANI